MTAVLDILNLALVTLEENRVSAEDETQAVEQLRSVFDAALAELLALHDWRDARARAVLPKSVEVPAFEFQNLYPLPSDVVRIIHVMHDIWPDRPHPWPWVQEGQSILTDIEPPLRVVYTRLLTADDVMSGALRDPLLKSALAYRIAAIGAAAVTGETGAREIAEEKAMKTLRAATARDLTQGQEPQYERFDPYVHVW